MSAGFFEQVHLAVRGIPRGRVATYGQIARLLGVPRGARAVGWALRALGERSGRRVPWHRVLGAGGRITLPGLGGEIQRRKLRQEGVRFSRGGVDLARYGQYRPAQSLARIRARSRKAERPFPRATRVAASLRQTTGTSAIRRPRRCAT